MSIDQQIMIGGQMVKVLKIMDCKTTWLYKFYINPLNNFKKIGLKDMRNIYQYLNLNLFIQIHHKILIQQLPQY